MLGRRKLIEIDTQAKLINNYIFANKKMAATQDKIRLLNDQISKLRTIETHYQATKNELKLADLEFEKLEENLNEEYADIESLEKLTLKGVCVIIILHVLFLSHF